MWVIGFVALDGCFLPPFVSHFTSPRVKECFPVQCLLSGTVMGHRMFTETHGYNLEQRKPRTIYLKQTPRTMDGSLYQGMHLIKRWVCSTQQIAVRLAQS